MAARASSESRAGTPWRATATTSPGSTRSPVNSIVAVRITAIRSHRRTASGCRPDLGHFRCRCHQKLQSWWHATRRCGQRRHLTNQATSPDRPGCGRNRRGSLLRLARRRAEPGHASAGGRRGRDRGPAHRPWLPCRPPSDRGGGAAKAGRSQARRSRSFHGEDPHAREPDETTTRLIYRQGARGQHLPKGA